MRNANAARAGGTSRAADAPAARAVGFAPLSLTTGWVGDMTESHGDPRCEGLQVLRYAQDDIFHGDSLGCRNWSTSNR
jgi:hypothetical protein